MSRLREGSWSSRVAEALERVTASPEWSVLGKCHPNVLVRSRAAEAVVEALTAMLRQPVRIVKAWRENVDMTAGTMVLHGVDRLERPEQHALLDWLNARAGRVQIIAIIRQRLYPLVADGRFLRELYYRLNCLYLDDRVFLSAVAVRP